MWKKDHWSGKVFCVLVGMVISYMITVIGILIMAFALYQWNMSVSTAEIGILVLYFLSCFIGGIVVGKRAESRKFLWGLLLGICYFLVLLLFSLIGKQSSPAEFTEIIFPGIICLFSGMLGGMLV